MVSFVLLYIINTLIFDIKDRYQDIIIRYGLQFTPFATILIVIALIIYWILSVWLLFRMGNRYAS